MFEKAYKSQKSEYFENPKKYTKKHEFSCKLGSESDKNCKNWTFSLQKL